ncbi:sigma-54-dependent transcriptional regulator [Catalinimonas niigatensis]|uniref:sigma-54-dependent transcriptional regulator n=1 Tax=Catalinimonas niigatensis TaxID=1397264 RepID=UPI0026664AC7|nr:sigma-54 dependent transcriptional regulator [Catalinimonas niigatensis]WPP50244.1 sigma-54 dependent transcriptional regulator [Catalinimonas niigatensis]
MDTSGKSILVVEDEENLRGLLSKILSLEGFKIHEAGDVTTAKDILFNETVHLVVTDVMLPDSNGIEFTKFIKKEYPLTEVVVLTAFGNVKDGVRAMKLGAFDYLTKGDGDDMLPMIAKKAVEKAVLHRQVQEMEFRPESQSCFKKIIGKSRPVTRMIELAKKVAVTDTTVLLLGETGTGKELLAEAIHLSSRRRKGPFVTINCAAIPKDLQESELFGHKKGSFTGATMDKKGYFEVADRGTIFLDELGEMSPELQAKLLRALENRSFNRVGDTSPIPVDIRIIAATNRDLLDDENSEFRRDLYYRLSTFAIDLPPLRERPEDIEMIALHFLKINTESAGREMMKIDPEFMYHLREHHWPGNIRELKNVIERAVILSDDLEITADTLPNEVLTTNRREVTSKQEVTSKAEVVKEVVKDAMVYATAENDTESENDSTDLKTVEQEHILRVLTMVNGNKSEAAKRLDIGLATLYRKLKEYNVG